MEGSHGRDEVGLLGNISPVKDLGTNGNVTYVGRRVKGFDILLDPPASCARFRDGGDVAIGEGDYQRDARVGEGFNDFVVHIEDLDRVDDGLGLKEVHHLRRWREVVTERAVVDSDGVSGGGEMEEEKGEEEELCRHSKVIFPTIFDKRTI